MSEHEEWSTMGASDAEQYREACERLWRGMEQSPRFTEKLSGFWRCWTALHLRVLEAFAAERLGTGPEWQTLSDDFMKTRERMVSAVVQGLQLGLKQTAAGDPDYRKALAEVLRRHDAHFLPLLEARSQMLRDELARAQAAKKAIGAYASQARQMGEG